MRLFWLLPKAAPALLRHLAAYLELAGLDLARAHREFTARLIAMAILAVCVLFAVFLGLLTVVALTWDTPYRVAAIASMGGVFLAAAIIAAVYRSKVARAKTQFLSTLRHEWNEDRVLLERLLSSDQE